MKTSKDELGLELIYPSTPTQQGIMFESLLNSRSGIYLTQIVVQLKGKVELTDTEKKIYEFIKSKGKVTRQDVMKKFSFSDEELKAQLITLMHSEMVKERSEAGKQYLTIIPVSQ